MKPKAVLDTSVLIGPERDALMYLAHKGLFRIVWSSYGIAEYARVYMRQCHRLNVPERKAVEELNNWIGEVSKLAKYAEYTRLTRMRVPLLRDPDDVPFLATAIVGNAQYFVSDNTADFPPPHLNPFPHPLHPFRRVRYITGPAFIDEILRGHPRLATRMPRSRRGTSRASIETPPGT